MASEATARSTHPEAAGVDEPSTAPEPTFADRCLQTLQNARAYGEQATEDGAVGAVRDRLQTGDVTGTGAERRMRLTLDGLVQKVGVVAITLYVVVLITGEIGQAITDTTGDNESFYFSGTMTDIDNYAELGFTLTALGVVVLVGGALMSYVRQTGGDNGGNR